MAQQAEITVLLADDHEMVRQGLAAILEQEESFKIVGHCKDGVEVVEAAKKASPDVVVLDISMPNLNGLDACREIARRCPKTAVLILTMHTDEQFVARALSYGASGYLIKDAAAEQLAQAVKAVARHDLFLGPGIPRNVIERVGRKQEESYDSLTHRERQILQLVAEGRTNRAIAEHLELAVKTVDTHRTRLMRKLNIHDQTSLVKYAIRKGLVSLDYPL